MVTVFAKLGQGMMRQNAKLISSISASCINLVAITIFKLVKIECFGILIPYDSVHDSIERKVTLQISNIAWISLAPHNMFATDFYIFRPVLAFVGAHMNNLIWFYSQDRG
jgi:hypothetical protein